MSAYRRSWGILALGVVLGALTPGCSADSAASDQDAAATPGEYDPAAAGTDWQILTDAEVESEYLEYAEYLATAFGLDPNNAPALDPVRFVNAQERPQVIVDCITAAGYSVRASQGGVVLDGDLPQDQAGAFNLTWYNCEVSYPPDIRTQGPLPRVRAEMQYDHLVQTVAPCVREQGFDIPEPPSMSTWLDAYYSSDSVWDPFSVVGDEAPERLEEIYELCPYDAPNLYPSTSE